MSYDRATVERLIPTIWDRTYAYGMANPYAPDPDMPKSKPNVSHGNTLFAHLIDVRTAWDKATLNDDERRAMLLYYAVDLTQEAVAAYEGVSQQTISARLFTGVGQLAAELNGTEFIEEEAELEDASASVC